MSKFQTTPCNVVLAFLVGLLFVGCGDETPSDDANSNDTTVEPTNSNNTTAEGTFSVDGHVSGLEGAGLVLGMNDDYALHIDDNGPFTFQSELGDASSYDISVLTDPSEPQQNCQISGGSGIIDGADIDDISVTCQTPAPPSPASFDVTIDTASSQLEVHATETVLVNVEIENTGDEADAADIELIIEDEFVATQQLSVDGLSTQSLTFEWTTDITDVGTYTAEVSSPDDTDSAPVIVNRATCEQRTLLGDLDEWELADDVVEGRDSDPSSYLGVFMGDEFPGTTNSLDFYLPKYRYAAMEFTVPESLETGHRGLGQWRSLARLSGVRSTARG